MDGRSPSRCASPRRANRDLPALSAGGPSISSMGPEQLAMKMRALASTDHSLHGPVSASTDSGARKQRSWPACVGDQRASVRPVHVCKSLLPAARAVQDLLPDRQQLLGVMNYRRLSRPGQPLLSNALMVLNDSCAHQERLASAVGTAALSWPCDGREPSARALVRDGQSYRCSRVSHVYGISQTRPFHCGGCYTLSWG